MRPPEAPGTDRRPARHGGPLAAAGPAEPLPELACQDVRAQPPLRLHAGQRGACALCTHPQQDAQGPRRRRLSPAFHIGGNRSRPVTTSPVSTGARTESPSTDACCPWRRGALPEDFLERLHRLKETSAASPGPPSPRPWAWTASRCAASEGASSPAGQPCTPLFRFALRMPGGLEILMGEGFRMTFGEKES